MKRSLLFCMFCIMPTAVYSIEKTAQYESAADIDAEIARLEEQKRVMKARADSAGRDASRLMFQDWIGYRFHVEEESRYRTEVTILENKIAALKAKQK